MTEVQMVVEGVHSAKAATAGIEQVAGLVDPVFYNFIQIVMGREALQHGHEISSLP